MEHFVVFTKHCLDLLFPNNGMELIMGHITGKSFSEALILASTNQQYDKRLSYFGLIDAKIRASDKYLSVRDDHCGKSDLTRTVERS